MSIRMRASILAVLAALSCAAVVQPAAAQGLPESFATLEFNYCDADGPGTLTVTRIGDSTGTDASVISASLTQGGNSFSGIGIARQVQPQIYLLAFAVGSEDGALGFFDGLLTQGIDSWSAQGVYRLAESPNKGAPWRANVNFPPLPASCS
jgi:hypothetical protein